MEGKYFFNGKDISMNLYSKTYKALQNTENTLWAESAGYIADRYYEEQEEAQISK